MYIYFDSKLGRMSNKTFLKKMEDFYHIYISDNYVELETFTNAGVNIIITLDLKDNLQQQYRDYVETFDMNEEIDFYRQIEDYRKCFTISQSLNDFQKYDDFLMNTIHYLQYGYID